MLSSPPIERPHCKLYTYGTCHICMMVHADMAGLHGAPVVMHVQGVGQCKEKLQENCLL